MIWEEDFFRNGMGDVLEESASHEPPPKNSLSV